MAEQWDPTKEQYVDYLVRMQPQWAPPPPPAPAAVGAAQPDAAVPPSLATDPAYLAFQAALGVQRSNAERSTQNQIDAINQSLPTRLAELTDQGNRQRRSMESGFEARGLLRSSIREQAEAEQRAAEARAAQGLTTDATNRTTALRDALATQLAGFEMQSAGQRSDAAQRQQEYTDNAALQAQLANWRPQVDNSFAEALAALQQPTVATPAIPAAPQPTPQPPVATPTQAKKKPVAKPVAQDLIRRGLS